MTIAHGEIHIRPVDFTDFDTLTHIMYDTWYRNESASSHDRECQISVTLARLDTANSLATSTHAVVAVKENRILGTAMWRNDSAWQRGETLTALAAETLDDIARQCDDDELVKKAVDGFYADARTTEQLARPIAYRSQAELRLLMLDKSARGMSVGSQLLDHAQESMRASGAKSYYLYTDSDCDYSFYDHLGFTREAENLQEQTPYGLVDKFIYAQKL